MQINEDYELMVHTTLKDFPNAKLRLLQTIMRLNDLPNTAQYSLI